MNHVYLLTGGNLGKRVENLEAAKTLVENRIGRLLQTSSIYETQAWGRNDQPDYLNQVLEIETPLDAHDILAELLAIEQLLGRVRQEKYDARVIDIDILFVNSEVIDEPGLTVPHPMLHKRRFVMEPLCEIAPGLVHPVFHVTIKALLNKLDDPLCVKKF